MSRLYRTQILLERQQHEQLSIIARQEGRSVSEIMRQIVAEYLSIWDSAVQKRRELLAIESLAQIRQQVRIGHGDDVGALLAEAREERENDIERIWGEAG